MGYAVLIKIIAVPLNVIKSITKYFKIYLFLVLIYFPVFFFLPTASCFLSLFLSFFIYDVFLLFLFFHGGRHAFMLPPNFSLFFIYSLIFLSLSFLLLTSFLFYIFTHNFFPLSFLLRFPFFVWRFLFLYLFIFLSLFILPLPYVFFLFSFLFYL